MVSLQSRRIYAIHVDFMIGFLADMLSCFANIMMCNGSYFVFFIAVRIRPYYGSFHTQIVESSGVGSNLPAENTESVSEKFRQDKKKIYKTKMGKTMDIGENQEINANLQLIHIMKYLMCSNSVLC